MANTGYQRSLTVTISKTVAGVAASGYPHVYYGRNEFIHNGVTYLAIDQLVMATMPTINYQERLAAFKAYVENIESGLNINADTIAGKEAYRYNLGACPII